MLAILALVCGFAGAVSAVPQAALAATTGSATTNAGQPLSISVTAPADGTSLTGPDVTVSGTARLGDVPPVSATGSVVLLGDVSGSTTRPEQQDCNGDGHISGALDTVGGDNLNGDGQDPNFGGFGIGDMLDCEIAGMRSLAAGLPATWTVGIGGFAGTAAIPAPAVAADDSAAIATATAGLSREQVASTALDPGTNLAGALSAANTYLDSAGGGTREVVVLTDGAGDDTSNSGALFGAIGQLHTLGARVWVYVVNPSGTCAPSFDTAATQTGGGCRVLGHFADAATLTGSTAPPAATLGSVTVRLDGVRAGTSDVDASGNWSVPVTVPAGSHTLQAIVSASDGTSASASTTVTGVPSAAATSTGQLLRVGITSPATGTRTATPPDSITGTVALSDFAPVPQSFAYVVDVSGSTNTPNHMDCNGDGALNLADNVNHDVSIGDTLDCELAGVQALNAKLPSGRDIAVGVEALGSTAAFAQMTTTAGTTAVPYTDATDVNMVLSSMAIGTIGQFKSISVDTGTDYDDALIALGRQMSAQPDRAHVAYLLSDGQPDVGDLQFHDGLAAVEASNTVVNTFGVGASSGTCAANAPLAVVAAQTGGTCAEVTNPAKLVAALSQPLSISSVQVRIDSGPAVEATIAADGSWSAPASMAPGNHLVTATATASDGSTATETSTIDVLATPDVSFPQDMVHVDQGSSVTLSPTVTDADTPAGQLTYSWSPADGLDDPSSASPVAAAGEVGSRTFTLTVTDPDGNRGQAQVTVVTDDVAPTITSLDAPGQAATGTPVTATLEFTDPGATDAHTVTFYWGDGTTSTASVTEPDGSHPGTANGTHTYTSGGSDVTFGVTVADDHGLTDQQQRALFVDTTPTVSAGGPTYTVAEGSSVQLEGSASDRDPGDSLTVAWTQDGNLTAANTATPTFHAVDDGSTPLTITATDSHGVSASDNTNVVVTNVPPSVDTASVPDGMQLPGAEIDLSSSFTDPGVRDTHTATVDWGDGASDPATVIESGGDGTLTGSHRYTGSGVFTVTVTVADKDGGVGTRTARVSVDSRPTVSLPATYTIGEGSSVVLAASGSDPDGDALTYSWTPADAAQLSSPSVAQPTFTGLDDATVPLTVTVTDPYGLQASATTTVTVNDVAPTVTSLAGPLGPTPVGSAVTLTGAFTDPGLRDTHTGSIAWGDGTSTTATVDPAARTFTASHIYSAPVVVNPVVTVTDNSGKSGSATLASPVVAYDPSGSFVTGGGYTLDANGVKNNIGFNARYPKGSTTPSGSVEYQDKAAGIALKSVTEQWLVTNTPRAQLQGSATVNGVPGYGYQLTVIDGQAAGGAGADRVRIRIWGPNGATVYDTQPGAPDSATPTTTLSGGSITVH